VTDAVGRVVKRRDASGATVSVKFLDATGQNFVTTQHMAAGTVGALQLEQRDIAIVSTAQDRHSAELVSNDGRTSYTIAANGAVQSSSRYDGVGRHSSSTQYANGVPGWIAGAVVPNLSNVGQLETWLNSNTSVYDRDAYPHYHGTEWRRNPCGNPGWVE
jgi:hypothetical protein